jgi:hypothetical protein
MKALDILGCVPLDNNKEYMIEDLTIVCWTRKHFYWIAGVTIPICLIWILGNPFFIFYKINYNKHDFYGNNNYYGFFINGFTDEKFYWFLMNFYSKAVLVLFNKVIVDHKTIYKAVFALLIMISLKEITRKRK